MGARAVSPGGALLRSSRMFSIPKPLPDPPSQAFLTDYKSDTATRPYPQRQTITSPLSSREKGDWGLKRPLPLKTTMATTTPLLRVKQVDSTESITDFQSASDHSLSMEKFQEMHIALSVPAQRVDPEKTDSGVKSVFEEDSDFTHLSGTAKDNLRWKFNGPWLARMDEGDFAKYLAKKVKPRRAEFRALLRQRFAEYLTTQQNLVAREKGEDQPEEILPSSITADQFNLYLRTLRNDRATLYAFISKFLDLAPLGMPVGIMQTELFALRSQAASSTKYGRAGPPPCHPSAGISYLRTSSFMENHPVYGPQATKKPVLSRVVSPRVANTGAKLGVGGFVASVPQGQNEFNASTWARTTAGKKALSGITHLDLETFGGAKAYVNPYTAKIDTDGRVIIHLRETSQEAQMVAKEARGQVEIYNDQKLSRDIPEPRAPLFEDSRMDKVADEILFEKGDQTPAEPEKDIVGSSTTYGLDDVSRTR